MPIDKTKPGAPGAETPRYARKNMAEHRPAVLPAKVEITQPPAPPPESVAVSTRHVSAAHKALGFAEAPAKKATDLGARNAVHGMGMFGGFAGKMKKGLLVGLTGLTLMTSMGNALPAAANPFHGPQMHRIVTMPVQHDVSRITVGGERAIADAQRVLSEWDQQRQLDPTFNVTNDRARELVLAAALPATPAAGEDLVAFAKRALSADTQQLILTMIDRGTFAIGADAKQLLELSAGRLAAVSIDGKLSVVGDQKDGIITLRGVPGASVEVTNLSTIPSARLHADETFVLGKIAADGTFSAKLDGMQQGDVIRMRIKSEGAVTTTSEWVDFKAQGMGAETRGADVALFRIGLSDNGNDTIAVTNINASRPVSEPGAVMRFHNERTGEHTDVTFDKNGTFPSGTVLKGKTGDQFSVRVTDGTIDAQLVKELAKLSVRKPGQAAVVESFNIADPTLHADELDAAGKPKFAMERFRGPLFTDGATFADVHQGQIGDCYFPAAIASIAKHMPGTFEKMMKEKREVDQTTGKENVWYEVTFKQRDWSAGRSAYKDVVIKVDGDLFVRGWGGPLYGASAGARTPEEMELWFPILEKAYAQLKGGSYNAIGNGGHVSAVFSDTLGRAASQLYVGGNPDDVWAQVKASVDAKLPIGAGTHGESQEAIYANTGVYSDHAYSILGYKEEAGVKYVQLRNPWGESEPMPLEGKNDGVFHLKLEDFMKLYATVYFVEAP